MTPSGQRDYSSIHLSAHALERFVERFGALPQDAAPALRGALGRTRRLGRNPDNGAVAVLAVHRGRALVAILQQSTCLTVLTWPQFLPRLPEFGRTRVPRKWGRLLRRLVEPPVLPEDGATAESKGRRSEVEDEEEPAAGIDDSC